MRPLFLFFIVLSCLLSISQDSATTKRIDSIVQYIDGLKNLKVFDDTVGFYGSDDASTVKGFHTDTYYYDSSDHLIKVVSRRPWEPNTYFFNNDHLIKAVIFWYWDDNNYLNNTGHGRRRTVVNDKDEEYYYTEEHNNFDSKKINALINIHPEQREFWANLSVGMEFKKQSRTKY